MLLESPLENLLKLAVGSEVILGPLRQGALVMFVCELRKMFVSELVRDGLFGARYLFTLLAAPDILILIAYDGPMDEWPNLRVVERTTFWQVV